MARLIISESHIMWFALKGNASYAMRSDRVLLIREQPAAGQRKAAHVGWQVAERKVMDFTKLRLDLVAKGFMITREVKVNENSFQLEAKGSESLCSSNSDSTTTKNGETEMDMKTLTTAQLVEQYNKATGKSIKKFASRAKGEAQLAKALAAATPKPQPRTVRGSASAQPAGRPKKNFVVKATGGGNLKLTGVSLRRQAMLFIEGSKNQSASLDELNAKFDRNMNGVVRVLVKCKFLKVVES